ncbi:uncharacterized protein LOC113493857 [Trichoplusia ni]|uniref:Uncharacterized protein LOC113493857 n=1 Tax=Trichoplusia ni TaxID=7111 RepID=A0A7E5VHA5_TRINI|nr:uncharacterized protein LOC113493857 [Trichoplusia ni]
MSSNSMSSKLLLEIMSGSASYSPVLDIISHNRISAFNEEPERLNLQENLIEDDYPITNPFYYAQDRESWDAEVAAKAYEESRQQKAEEQTTKKKKNKSKSMSINKSYIMRKESAHVRHLIKIMIHDLDGRPMDKIRVNPEDASVDVQYLVT